ncbi:sulfatase [uncultured Polaribacter sp.]|uniref:sulfatase family protein n=1 Tax=uncultured Polaribacter sp. TaxID=174711 RepID=UPI0026231C36|nr:sulfatase [uncultured Polaribacter sp.]
MKTFFYFFLYIVLVIRISAQEKPNILWITIEDTSPQFIGVYGNKNASTPNIDKLAIEGIRFTNAFSTGTVCSPSRSTIITGIPTYKMGTGNHRSNYPIPEFIHGFPYYLKQQGYYTSNNVKTDYNIANEKDFIKEAWDESSGKATWANREDKNQPFFSVFNYAASHQSRTMSMPFNWYKKYVWDYLSEEDRIGDNEFEMPPFYKDTPEMRKQFARVYNSIKLTDNRIGELLKKLEDDNLTENTIIFFYADHGEGMPRGKTNGINYGYRVPFIIKFPEKFKHLSPWGKAGTVSSELINFEDLAPTIISLADGKVPEYLKGRALIGKNRDKERDHLLLSTDRADNGSDLVRTITDGRFVYSRNFMPFMPEMRYIRYLEIAEITQQMRLDYKNNQLNSIQKSLFNQRSTEVLYDIENDSWETKNLIHNLKYKSVLKKMRKQLTEDVLKAKDIHFATEYEIGLISKTTTPYEYRLDDEKYPFKKIYKVAMLSGEKGNKIAKKQIKLLKNNNKIIRYWAVVGLMSQKKEILNCYQKELTKALEDSYPPVAITTAAILYENFQDKKSEGILLKFSKSDNMDLALMTINYLLYVDDKQAFIETIQKVHKMPKRNYNIKAACMDFLSILDLVENTSKTEN